MTCTQHADACLWHRLQHEHPTEALLQGPVDASGRCCAQGIVDTFGVCNGYDASGTLNITVTVPASSTADAQAALAQILGVAESSLSSATM